MEEPFDINDIVNMVPLDTSTNQLAQDIIDEQDVDKVKNLVHLFNLNQAKKNVLRVFKYNALLDALSDEALKRVQNRSGEFSNSDLVGWMQVAQQAIDRANKSINLVDETPAIQINQINNINVSEPLDRDSRMKIRDAVNAVLTNAKKLSIIQDTDIPTEEDIIEEETIDNKLNYEEEIY